MPAKSTRGKMTLVRQTCELIPGHLVPKLAKGYAIDARKFSAWSHTTAHVYGQLTHAVGLNDICDGLELNSSGLRAIRGATPPKRNTFSHANRTRDPRMAEDLYWRMIEYLPTTGISSLFGSPVPPKKSIRAQISDIRPPGKFHSIGNLAYRGRTGSGFRSSTSARGGTAATVRTVLLVVGYPYAATRSYR